MALNRLAPPGSRTRATLGTGRRVARDAVTYASLTRWRWRSARMPDAVELDYRTWLDHQRRTPEALQEQKARIRQAGIALSVDCLLLPGPGSLVRTLGSLRAQTFQAWSARVLGTFPAAMRGDQRIRGAGDDPAGAWGALSAAGSPRDFVLVALAGDVLEPDLLFEIAARGWDDPLIDVVHWDDDLIDAAGAVRDPRVRPAFSPETLLSANYLGRAFAVRRSRLQRIGEIGTPLEPGFYWRLVLGLDLGEREVARVTRVLQHAAERPAPTPSHAVEIVSEHLRRQRRSAEVIEEGGAVRVRWQPARWPSVSVVIPTRRREELLAAVLDDLERTDYPELEVLVVDSGERDDAFYRGRSARVRWWEGPFNYSTANNLAASDARGEVLVFLNDDTRLSDPGWLKELVGWACQPGIGVAGLQLLDGSGAIQHGGVVVGLNGFAGHLFAGMRPGEDSLIGPTSWYRNCLSVTGACLAITREQFEAIGGFDERMTLCGSDVVLGLDARFNGARAVCSPFGGVRHLEAQTRGAEVPRQDFFASYWRYQRWLRGGDPYFSPSLSLSTGRPALRDPGEPEAMAAVGRVLGRDLTVFRQQSSEQETLFLVKACRADAGLRERLRASARTGSEVHTVNWFLPDLDSPFYGGVHTALRIADLLARRHGIENQFVLLAEPNESYVRSALQAAFPALAEARIDFSDGRVGAQLQTMPAADVSIATQWHTAYMAANFEATARRYYLIQDFEPSFYPAGSNYALAEETYRLGLLGVCNTEHMLALYRERYGGAGMAFTPAVDGSVFHARGRDWRHDGPVTIFAYARPGHWRNCWELASLALRSLKRELGDRVRIVTAGSWALPDDLGWGIEHLGMLDYRDTGELYRRCDIGLALTVSEHPSYLPLELLACGTPVVAFDNPAGDWLLEHGRNCLRTPRTADGVAQALEQLVLDRELRERLGRQGVADIGARHGDWDAALGAIHEYLRDPVRG